MYDQAQAAWERAQIIGSNSRRFAQNRDTWEKTLLKTDPITTTGMTQGFSQEYILMHGKPYRQGEFSVTDGVYDLDDAGELKKNPDFKESDTAADARTEIAVPDPQNPNIWRKVGAWRPSELKEFNEKQAAYSGLTKRDLQTDLMALRSSKRRKAQAAVQGQAVQGTSAATEPTSQTKPAAPSMSPMAATIKQLSGGKITPTGLAKAEKPLLRLQQYLVDYLQNPAGRSVLAADDNGREAIDEAATIIAGEAFDTNEDLKTKYNTKYMDEANRAAKWAFNMRGGAGATGAFVFKRPPTPDLFKTPRDAYIFERKSTLLPLLERASKMFLDTQRAKRRAKAIKPSVQEQNINILAG
jgi:hypothetical protein